MPEKQNKTNKLDLELLEHKYSDFYPDYFMYDAHEIDYPIYRTKVTFLAIKELKLHPIIVAVLNTIEFLESLNDSDVHSYLKEITQLDEAILDSILADITTKGYLKQEGGLKLSKNGREMLKMEAEKITEPRCAYINFDGIFGTSLIDNGKPNRADNKARDGAIEFKPYVKSRPRIECIDEEFTDNKTLRQVLIENLKSKDYDIADIQQIAPSKFFKRYFCLFYKDSEENEKFLALNSDYEIDDEATELFDRLMQEQKFNSENVSQNSKVKFEDSQQKFNDTTPELISEKIKDVKQIDIVNGKTIEVDEHKKYFIYVLEHAKKHIFIQSPWINWRTLQIYKDYIKKAVERGVHVTIKYGMKPRNRFDKIGIDKESEFFFNKLNKEFFSLIKKDDHSKIIICDDDFMIMGSFNWLSFGGGNAPDARGETSSINMNREEIKKQKEKFK